MEPRKLAAVAVLLFVFVAPLAYLGAAYHSYAGLVDPQKPKASADYVVVYTLSAQFYVLTKEKYEGLISSGYLLPEGSKIFNVTLESFITGSPEVDLNLTLRSPYEYFTIVVGAPSVADCKDSPQLYVGDCRYRTITVSEVSGVVSNIFSTNYYLRALQMGYDNKTAREYASNQTWLRYRKRYLTFWTKIDIGRGKIGNPEHLVVLLIGPAEGARENKIFAPRRGVLVIEGTTDETLRAEVILIENLIGFKWPQGNTTQTITG
ncbi:hypothetical protein E3E36_09885 [Thermococcus sp. M36]|uniref:hypothetical protein n=1 Tax=Thermococcus sp. M36 TaxID=1638261 RepID=UPI00143CB4C5|nr:hypothetical protein [Thermococcus sp. M36]NJE06443.1 hypothetical protein [Thermococcus sp. M36]